MSAECTVLCKALESEALTPVFLPGESQGRGSLVGCCLWGLTESDTTEANFAAAAESEADLAPVIILFDTIRLGEQGMKAASKVAVYFVSSRLGLFEEHACLGTKII